MCLLLVAVVMGVCAFVGSQEISVKRVLTGRGESPGDNVDYEIFMYRLRRVILAGLVGAALAGCGVVLQAILRNPLADPYILGVSSGAGLGVVIAVLCGLSWRLWFGSPVAIFAFAGALSAVWLVWCIGHFAGKSQVTSLLLAGVVVNAFLSAVMMFLISVAKSDQLHSTIFWLMGNITEKDWPALLLAGGCIIAGLTGLFCLCHRLNVLTFGEQEARSLGISAVRTRLTALSLAAFVTAVAVSLSGLIGFAGLIIPHSVRLVFGPDHRQLLPLSAAAGAAFLIIADTIARVVVAPAQLPVGVITAIAGGPFFLVLLARYTRKVSWLK
jgi:iron complex transport system permease protein